jgi:Fe-S cluster assembly iron-binding protein IscA
MLALTPRAAAVLAETRTRRGLPNTGGLRISAPASDSNGDGAAYHLSFVADPGPADVVVEGGTTRVFVAPEVAQPLEWAVLDAEETAYGRRLILRSRR